MVQKVNQTVVSTKIGGMDHDQDDDDDEDDDGTSEDDDPGPALFHLSLPKHWGYYHE